MQKNKIKTYDDSQHDVVSYLESIILIYECIYSYLFLK